MKSPQRILLAALVLGGTAALGLAQIERLTLEEMVSRAQDAVHGEVVNKQAFRVDHPIDGPELYFTTLTIEGRSLFDGQYRKVEITYAGGWIDEENGVWNSEAPSEEDTAVGRKVVAFYRWTENMGGDVSGNALYAAHGGLYRTVQGRERTVVLGRGEGYAVRANIPVEDLTRAIAKARRGR